MIKKRIYARAGLLGNPSDGYHGKTIAISVRNFWSQVVLYEWDEVEIVLAQDDRARFRSIQDLATDVQMHGYYGGIRLIKATVKRFVEYCQAQGLALHKRNFSVRYETNIPRQVGLAGSSSIIIATLRCLLDYYKIDMPLEIQPSFALAVETDELGIAAGLQDRVIQCYENIVYMDFDPSQKRRLNGLSYFAYAPLQPPRQFPLYVAIHSALSEPTEVFHNDLKGRFDRGEESVANAMRHFADLAAEGRAALVKEDVTRLKALIDDNFDTRRSICRLPDWQIQMVETARRCGASAKFAGSGGSIIGTYDGEGMFERLRAEMARVGSRVIKPQIYPASS
ncbi:MAG: GHMP kinase [Vicinamibacteria bacterium]|nr:GHMP kinase [Vicinamibacteria bacterium]